MNMFYNKEFYEKYRGKCVAMVDNEIIAVADDLEELDAKLEKMDIKKEIKIDCINEGIGLGGGMFL